MKPHARGTASVILLLLGLLALPGSARALIGQDQEFPDLNLPSPTKAEEAAYLGVKQGQSFGLGDIDADFLLLEVMSALCPHCQADADDMNEVFASIQRQGLGDELKVLGVGVNNTEFELELFKSKYGVLFPLVPDQNMTTIEKAGVMGTPTYFLLDLRDGSQAPKVLHVHEGRADDADSFLRTILREAGLNGTAERKATESGEASKVKEGQAQ